MDALCVRCGVQCAPQTEEVLVDCFGVSLRVPRRASECDSCTAAKWRSLYRAHARNLLPQPNGHLRVNWDRFHEELACVRRSVSRSSPSHHADLFTDFLIFAGVLSFRREGNWDVRSEHGLTLGPSAGIHQLYFTDAEHARGFALASSFLRIRSGWYIVQVGKGEAVSSRDAALFC